MSGNYENLPFKRGATYGVTDDTLATGLEGKEYTHQDQAYGTGAYVRVRICRNNSGATLQGKRLAKLNLTAGKNDWDVSGYATVTAERAYVIDEFLPAAGVPDNDLFYVVIEGPTLAKTDLASGAGSVFAVGDYLHALTAVTTGATTAGRVAVASFAGATAVVAGQIMNVVGRAMSARTTANTGADILIYAGRF